ncbi:YbgA family protein [Anaeromyxobacter paludicola]|uniref:DUF1722 domain-containing protein n=1 Tax=Anaeromyxobacter paludicola TaxID=2918171 RepID=A0ABN6NBS0_9BACT|nr:DUF523 and DUF1722 domain-containing protein [Anaeromyxobacter paludicola]BDG10684.1 hypothetical protein AMPC_37970 [Anaeromyxobacter paludicola]
MSSRPRLGISACLLGHNVRWDGGQKRSRFLADVLGAHVDWVPVCPELELGLGVPRETLRLVGLPSRPRLVAPRSGQDHTEAMESLAAARAEALAKEDLCGFVLKKDSPSCGLERVRVYRESGVPLKDGAGVFARALRARLPALPVEEEGRLEDSALRERFVERVFALRRWKDALAEGLDPGRLVAFHARHKLQLMAHSPAHVTRLGRLVARAGREDVVDAYGRLFAEALAVPASRGRVVNALQHMAGYVSPALTPAERRELGGLFSEYAAGKAPLAVPLVLVEHHLRRQGVGYLAQQSWLGPYPGSLALRYSVAASGLAG